MLVDRNSLQYRRVVAGLMLAAAACVPSPVGATGPASAPATQAASPPASLVVDDETTRLREMLRQEVPGLITDTAQSEAAWIQHTQAELTATGYRIDRPQLLVVVDRNPRVQQMRIVLARPDGSWQSLGGAKVSTGRPRGFERFLTPTGVFRHTDAILDWRAEGTLNERNVRGLGLAGMRVWDFGWQRAFKGWGPAGGVGTMRLLLHATDPLTLERRIGRAASDGCVRIPTAINQFLDLHGVLDADYERAAQRRLRFAAVLRADRTPTRLAGDSLVVIDSGGNAPPQLWQSDRRPSAVGDHRPTRRHVRMASAHRHR